MKAAVLESYKKFAWTEMATPSCGDDDVLVRIRYASICGTDMHIFSGDFHPRTPVPFIPGHEMGGVVEKTGKNVQGFHVGDKVAVDPIIWCGNCPACQRKHFPACTRLKLLGVDQDGGFAEFVVAKPHMLFVTSPELPDQYVALAEIYGIGFHANKRANTQKGDVLAIWGAGRVGQVILQAARTITEAPIYIVDPLDNRLDIATQSYPNVIGINPHNENPVDAILERTEGKGVDIAFEAVGHAIHIEGVQHPMRSAIQSLRGGGIVCTLGLSDEPAPVVFKELIWKEAKIVTSRVSDGEFTDVINCLNQGLLKPEMLISEILPAEEIQSAFEMVENEKEKYLKVLLDFSSV